MYCIPLCMFLFTKDEELHYKVLMIGMIPSTLLFMLELIEMKYRGYDYFIGKKLIDIMQALLYWTLQVMEKLGYGTAEFIPEIRLLLIVTSFMKLLYFLRIFEEYGFLIQMICFCIADLVPFIIFFVVFNFIFIICFIIIKMQIDPEVNEAPIESFVMKTAL